MLDEKRLALMRHWAESDAFREHPWVRELLDAYDGAALVDRTDRAAMEASILAIKVRVDFARNLAISERERVQALADVSEALGSLRAALASVEQGDTRE